MRQRGELKGISAVGKLVHACVSLTRTQGEKKKGIKRRKEKEEEEEKET